MAMMRGMMGGQHPRSSSTTTCRECSMSEIGAASVAASSFSEMLPYDHVYHAQRVHGAQPDHDIKRDLQRVHVPPPHTTCPTLRGTRPSPPRGSLRCRPIRLRCRL